MNNARVKKGFITATIISICVTAIFVFTFLNTPTRVFAAESAETSKLSISEQYDAEIKRYDRQASIDENFEDNKVIVILKNKYSNISDIGFDSFLETSRKIEFASIGDSMNTIDKSENRKLSLPKRKNQSIILELATKDKDKVLEAIAELSKLDMVLVAQPSYIYEIEAGWTPNDVRFNEQWGLRGTYGINSELAWDIARGNANVRVGIMEAGIDLDHDDLVGNVLTLSGGFMPEAGINLNHGTHVAGIIGAISNNHVNGSNVNAVAGVAQTSLVQLNWAGGTTFRTTLRWAEAHNIRIINASFMYGTEDSPAAFNADHFAALRDDYTGLFVACAHNQNLDLNTAPRYPANYNLPNVMAIGALNESGARSGTSNYGDGIVQVYAPGGNILSTMPSNAYNFMSGTSMSAPHVAGVAALMLSINPNLTATELRNTIINNGDDHIIQIPNPAGGTPANVDRTIKKLNAYKAVSAVAFTTGTASGDISINGFRTGYTMPNNTNLTLPESFAPLGTTTQQSVTAIGSSAFANQSQLSQITIPASVTSIGDNAFKNCTSLTTVNFESPSSLTSIGASAFAGCTQLSQITIPSGVTSIGALAFAGCTQLSQISLPSSIESIGMEAFVPGISLTGYGGDGTNINLIIVDGTKQSFVDNGWTGFNIVELSAAGPLTVTSGQLKGEIGIPTYFNNRMIEAIGENAFAGQAELTGITLPTSVTSIGASAFANCAELEYATYFSITGLASTPNQTASYIDSYYTERDLGIQLIQDYTYRLSLAFVKF